MDKDEVLIKTLKDEGIAVIPTDTLYGIVGRAESKETVERIYKLKERGDDKPFIVLISSLDDLALFKIKPNQEEKEILKKIWPGKISVVLRCESDDFKYLHRGKESLAFRIPDDKNLVSLIKKTGPLVAPSANKEGMPPAENIVMAKKYFGDYVDIYIEGAVSNSPSTLVTLVGNKIELVREGTVGLDEINKKIMEISFDEFKKVELKTGVVLEAEEVSGSDKLLKLLVDVGEDAPRQILAGMKEFYTPESFIGKNVCIVANLAPRKMMGLESQGMIMAADGETGPVLLSPVSDVPPGSEIR